MKVIFFAQLKSVAGCREVDIAVPARLSVDALWKQIESACPGMERFRTTTRLAKNQEFALSDTMFADTDEVALIPPVSGG
jgi:molybdopterin converting factor subunit 1